MITTVTSLPFAQLRNAEHVAFFNNVVVELSKFDATDLGLTAEKITQFKTAVNAEQDIVLKAQGSMYTADMQALDEERDRLYRLIRLKLQAAILASADSEVHSFATTIDKYILTKYGLDVPTAPYQEESALIRGFILDVKNYLPEDVITAVGISRELVALGAANDNFAEQYNERVTEKSGSTTEFTRKARAATEELFHLIGLHLEYKANTEPSTDAGVACDGLVAVINELIKDARQRLNVRLGKVADDSNLPIASPVPLG